MLLLSATLLLSVTAGACGAGSSPKRSKIPIAEEFSGETGSAVLRSQWWKALGDAHLGKAITQALGANFSLAAARSRLLQAKADAEAISGSALPSVSAELASGYRRSFGTVPGFNVFGATYSVGLAASYEIDLWGGIGAAKRQAHASVRAARFDFDAAAVTVSAEIATAWYRWVEAREQGALRKRQTKTSEQILALVEARYARGQVSAQEVFRQRQVVDAAQQAEVQMAAESQRWRNRFATLLGQSSKDVHLPESATLPTLPELPRLGTPVSIIAQRPDVQAAYQRLVAADAAAAVAHAARYPRISLQASITSSTRSISTLFQNWLLGLGGNLLAPLFNGGELRARAASARSAAQAAWFGYAEACLGAIAEIEDALTTSAEVASQVASLTRQVELAQRSLGIAQAGYASGQVTYLQALDAVLTLQTLERDLLQARRSEVEVRINLHRAVAGAIELPPNQSEQNQP